MVCVTAGSNPIIYGLSVKSYLFRLNFLPHIIINHIHIIPKILDDFTIRQAVYIREQGLVVLQVVVQQVISAFVGGCVGDVFKVFLGNVGAAQEVNPFFCIFLVLGIGRDDPGVNPVIGCLLYTSRCV